MRTVVVTVERAKIDEWKNTITIGNYIMRRLREEGVPVNDGLWPVSIGNGKITIEEDDFGDLVTTWEGE